MKSAGTTRREFAAQAALGLGLVAAGGSAGRAGAEGPGPVSPVVPGAPVVARIEGSIFRLANGLVSATWEAGAPPSGLRLLEVEDRRGRNRLSAGHSAFTFQLQGGTLLDSARMKLLAAPRVEALPGAASASRLSEREPGGQIVALFGDEGGRARVQWRGVLREGSHYIRQEVVLSAVGADLPVTDVCLVDLAVEGAAVRGTVKGSPVTAGPWFFGFEHPLSSSAAGVRARCSLERPLPLKAGQSASYSSVIGAAAASQMRRDFLRYVERERAHPYRTFLHYNSWYDLGYFTPFDEASAVAVIEAFGRELSVRRGVTLDSFLFDDGWDDHRLWGFNAGFPKGFAPLSEAARRFGSGPGVWLSPWGGYGKPRQERLAFGKEQGFESNEEGLALSGPVYFRRFREVCLEMIRRYGVNQFKLDGTGSSAKVVPGSAYGSDFEAAIALIEDLRAEKPGLFVNLTTGTYPSPFWLRYADSIWRGGEDHDFAGVGSDRQRWITYRDADTFANVVQTGPLYPLSSLMLHGLIFARHAKKLDTDPSGDFDAEVRSYFGSGTQLQEMYVTHALLSDANWDAIAEAAKWSRSNAATLADTHWVGGDPARLEAYGWAAWSPGRAILTLRNPSDREQSFELDPAAAFELPPSAAGPSWTMTSPWKKDAGKPPLRLTPGRPAAVRLAPFEVRTLSS